MSEHKMQFSNALLLALSLAAFEPAIAQRAIAPGSDYPSRPVRWVVPYPPGGGTDVLSRIIAQKLAAGLKQNVVVDNRGGAGGMIGVEAVAKSPPDGYTLLFMSSSYAALPFFFKKLPYDPIRDLMPVTLVGTNFGQVLVVHPGLPVRSVKELIALAKANPGKLDYGSAGSGNTTHIAAELFKLLAGVKMNHVPYKGGGNAIVDLVSGQIQVVFPAAQSVTAFIQAGRLRALAITGPERWHQLPAVPTLEESGLKGYKLVTWYGVWVPAGTRPEAVSRIQAEIGKVVTNPQDKQLFEEQGLKGVRSQPAELEKVLQDELALNRKILPRIGVVAE